MKTLVIQLARLGDLLQSLPAATALKRGKNDVYILCRKSFAPALEGLWNPDKIIQLNTEHILNPIINSGNESRESLNRLSKFVDNIQRLEFNKIINLTFSPFSSFLTHAISNQNTQVIGYTRYDDGYLSIPDDASAYFYAQVGVEKDNRFHLPQLFAEICGAEINSKEYENIKDQVNTFVTNFKLSKPYIIIHVGGSRPWKTLPPHVWVEIYESFLKRNKNFEIVLIGTESENSDHFKPRDRIINLIGKTKFQDLWQIVNSSELVVGGDSVLMSMGSLLNRPCLNVSLPGVNFWETHPWSPGSRVFITKDRSEKVVIDFVEELECVCNNKSPLKSIEVNIIELVRSKSGECFAWDLIRYLYLGVKLPTQKDNQIDLAVYKIKELAQLAQKNIIKLEKQPRSNELKCIIELCLNSIIAIGKAKIEVRPLISWFQTELIRIGPGNLESVKSLTLKKYQDLEVVAEDICVQIQYTKGGLDEIDRL